MKSEIDQQLNQAMLRLASDPKTIFVGQNVVYDGNVMFGHLANIPLTQRLELPVCEELQMGLCIGLSLQGLLPVSIYPRLDFLMRAMDQLVNHLDKLELMSNGQFKPKVIIRTRVGGRKPLNAGPQHTQDHTEALRMMLTNVVVFKIVRASDIFKTYAAALELPKPVLVVEAFGC